MTSGHPKFIEYAPLQRTYEHVKWHNWFPFRYWLRYFQSINGIKGILNKRKGETYAVETSFVVVVDIVLDDNKLIVQRVFHVFG